MRRNRFGDVQVIGVLKEHAAGPGQRRSAASTGSAMPRSARGGADAGCGDAARDARKRLLTPGVRRSADLGDRGEGLLPAPHLRELAEMHPKTCRCASRRGEDGGVRARLGELANARRLFGYRRLAIPLRRESIALNHKKLFRLYREERLRVRRRSAPGCRWRCRREPTRAGASTSLLTLSSTAAASAFWRPSMTPAARVWRWWRTARCRGRGSGVSSIGSWRCAAVRR